MIKGVEGHVDGPVRDALKSDPALGEGSGLVEAEHVDAAERLHRGGIADQDVPP
jgi:hypothetical protein